MMAPQIQVYLPLSSFEISASLESNIPDIIIIDTINVHIIKIIITWIKKAAESKTVLYEPKSQDFGKTPNFGKVGYNHSKHI